MGFVNYHPQDYQSKDLDIGSEVLTEQYYHNGFFKDENGNKIQVSGICQVVGIVKKKFAHHCNVITKKIYYPEHNIHIPIKEEYQYETSLNYWKGGDKSSEDEES